MHRTWLYGWGRNKRFDYWCVTSPDAVVAFSISDVDYRNGFSAFFLDRADRSTVTFGSSRWLRRNHDMSAPWGTTEITGTGPGCSVSVVPTDAGVRLVLAAPELSGALDVAIPDDHESMNVIVPWSRRRYQYTRKHNCLRASGTLHVRDRDYRFDGDDSYATLDHGRGQWPYSTVWNWASGSGHTDGHEIGLRFGGKWTAGTPSTENALRIDGRIDGRIEKISEELTWRYDPDDWLAPWHISGEQVDLTFQPEYNRSSSFDRIVVRSRENLAFGVFSGTVRSWDGAVHRVHDIFGWAEEVHRRW
ncbi:MAG: DUF2804 domain-containing protein [Pseudonocardia sp.]|nr:DUF2804 domain-containing protein [Pseudonocardia sp.]